MIDNEFGTQEQRIAVREATDALAAFNRRLDLCKALGVACEIRRHTEGPWTYTAAFTKTTMILPARRDDEQEAETEAAK
jgi:hypothetical protein